MTQSHPTATCLVFAYGSNLDEERMTSRVPSARFIARASLPLHALRFHKRGWDDGTGKANALGTGRSEDVVHGALYEVETAHLTDLDPHERGYDRRLIEVRVVGDEQGAARTIETWTYIARPEVIDDALRPARWYLDHVLRGARAHALPLDLIEALERQPVL